MLAVILCLHRNDAAMDRRRMTLLKNPHGQVLIWNTANKRLIERKELAKAESFFQCTFTNRLILRGGEDSEDPITGMVCRIFRRNNRAS